MTTQIPEEGLKIARKLFETVEVDNFGALELTLWNDEDIMRYIDIFRDGNVSIGDQVAINNRQFDCIERLRKIIMRKFI